MHMQSDKKMFLSGIAAKLAILVGGAIAATGANALPVTAVVPHPETNTISSPSATTQKTLAPKLILKQQNESLR